MSAPRLRWLRVPGAITTEVIAKGPASGLIYTIARYDGGGVWERWRLTSTEQEETLDWCRTLRDAKRLAERYEARY